MVLAIGSLLILVFILAGAAIGRFSEIVLYSIGQPEGTEPTGIGYTLSVLGIVFALLTAFISIGLAGLLFWRKRDDNMVLFLAYFLLLYGLITAGPLEAAAYLFDRHTIGLAVQGLFTAVLLPLLYIFPSGRFVPQWSKWLVPVIVLSAFPTMALSADMSQGTFPSWGIFLALLVFVLLGVGFFGQIYRYRQVSSQRERLQTKWVIYGLALYIGLSTISGLPYLYQNTLPPDSPIPIWVMSANFLWATSLTIIPITFTVAFLRHKLWDIDDLINRTLVYTVLTLLLLITYFAAIVLTQTLIQAATGQESPLAVVVSTLVIAGLFQPLRQRVQRFIDRRFYRRKYDKVQILVNFAQKARDEVDLEELTTSLVEVVEQSIQPATISLWLKTKKPSKKVKVQD